MTKFLFSDYQGDIGKLHRRKKNQSKESYQFVQTNC